MAVTYRAPGVILTEREHSVLLVDTDGHDAPRLGRDLG